jgi:hypothetical protein
MEGGVVPALGRTPPPAPPPNTPWVVGEELRGSSPTPPPPSPGPHRVGEGAPRSGGGGMNTTLSPPWLPGTATATTPSRTLRRLPAPAAPARADPATLAMPPLGADVMRVVVVVVVVVTVPARCRSALLRNPPAPPPATALPLATAGVPLLEAGVGGPPPEPPSLWVVGEAPWRGGADPTTFRSSTLLKRGRSRGWVE